MDDLGKIRGQQAAIADQADKAGAGAYKAMAQQLATVSPEVAGMVLEVLPTVVASVGGKLEGDPTTLADEQVCRALSAVADLTEDAAEAGVIEEDLVIRLESIGDDMGAQILAGQLEALSDHKPFHRWARGGESKPDEKPKADRPPAKPAAPEPDDDFLMSRMGKPSPTR